MSPEFIELVKQFGLRWAVVIFVVIVLYRAMVKHLIPWVKGTVRELIDHYKAQQDELNEARKKSFDELSGFVRKESVKNDQVLRSLTMLTAEIKEMRAERKELEVRVKQRNGE